MLAVQFCRVANRKFPAPRSHLARSLRQALCRSPRTRTTCAKPGS